MGCCLYKRRRVQQQPITGGHPAYRCPCCQYLFPANTGLAQINLHVELCIQNPALARVITNAPSKMPSNNLENQQYWEKTKVPGSQKVIWQKRTGDYEAVEQIVKHMSASDVQEQIFLYKQIWFRAKLEEIKIPWDQGSVKLNVKVTDIINTSIENDQIFQLNLHRELKIVFHGEHVEDAGGLLREYILILIRELFDEQRGLFVPADTQESYYRINPALRSTNKPEYLIQFRLFGIVLAKAILERIPISAYLDHTLLQILLGRPIEIETLRCYDEGLYNQLQYFQNTMITPENDICQTFSVTKLIEVEGELKQFQTELIDLKDGGQQIPVTEDNKGEYIQLCIQYFTYQSIKPYVDVMKDEFHKLIPKDLISIFQYEELEIIINGLPFIDVQDWKQNTLYKGIYNSEHQLIIWFWEWMEQLNSHQLQQFLQFCTGSSHTPVEGFSKLESNRNQISLFAIESVPFGGASLYPKAHTCFNRLDLPIYPDKERLIDGLTMAIDVQLQGVYASD